MDDLVEKLANYFSSMPWEKRLETREQQTGESKTEKLFLFKLQSNKNNLQIINYC